MKRPLLMISFATVVCSSIFAVIALGKNGHQSLDEMLTAFILFSIPNAPSLAAATIAVQRSKRSAGVWIVANLIVAVPICAIWLLLAISPVAKSTHGPVPSMVPGAGPLTITLHVVLAAVAFVVAALGDLSTASNEKSS